MWGLLLNFLNFAMTQVFRGIIIKFVLYTAIVLVVAGLAAFVFNALVDVDLNFLTNLMQGLPDGLLWFMQVFQVQVGLPLCIGAAVAKFTIRRIPIIG